MSWVCVALSLPIATLCLSLFVPGKAAFGRNDSVLQGVTDLDVDGNHSPVSGVLLTLISLDRALQTRSTRDGTFHFDNVPDGIYEMDVSAEGYARQQFPIQFPDAAVRSLDISLKLTSQPDMNYCGPHPSFNYSFLTGKAPRVTGVVITYPDHKALQGANLILSQPGNSEPKFRAVSDQKGRFLFDDVPAGCYELKVSRDGYISTKMTRLLVPRENNVEANFQIQRDDKRIVICQ